MSVISHVNPRDTYETLNSRGFTQVVVVRDARHLVYVSGQLPLDRNGRLVGEGNIEAQARAVFENLGRSLASVGTDLSRVIKLNTYVTDIMAHPPAVRRVRAEYLGTVVPPASTMVEVPRFAQPGILIEIDAVAVA